MHYEVSEARAKFSELLAKVQVGEEVVITKAGESIAKLVPIYPHRRRTSGTEKGMFWVAEDFDAPLPADIHSAVVTGGARGAGAAGPVRTARSSAPRTGG